MLPKIKVLKTIILSGTTPYSTNSLWFPTAKGKQTLAINYRKWRNRVAKLLPENFLPSDMTGYGLYIEVGVFREFDIDNTLKSLIDALQQAYGFNDNQIDYLYAKKKIVRNFDPSGPGDRSKDYIKISLVEAVEFEISADHIVWEPEEPSVLKKLDDYVQDDKWAFHPSGRNVKWDKFSES